MGAMPKKRAAAPKADSVLPARVRKRDLLVAVFDPVPAADPVLPLKTTRAYRLMGLTNLGSLPAPIIGARQKAVPAGQNLDVCPKCKCPWIQLKGREWHCPGSRGGCGGTWYVVMNTQGGK